MPTDIYVCNTLIIKRIINRSDFMRMGEATFLVTTYPFTSFAVITRHIELFGELFGSDPFFYGKTHFLGPAEKVDIKDLG